MPHETEHTPTVSTRSVNPYARESSREKRQQDRQTHRRTVQNHFPRRFEGCISQIRSYLEVDFLDDANTSIDMEVKQGLKQANISMSHDTLPAIFCKIGLLFTYSRIAKL